MSEQLNLLEGVRRRDEGVARVWYATPDEWRAQALLTIRRLADSRIVFTAEDVRLCVGDPPRQNAMGAAFQVASKQGLIRRVGYGAARRPSRHAATFAQWIGVGG